MVMRAGCSLVEVIVAMTLLSVGVIAVAGSGLLAAELLRESQLREEIMTRTSALIDSLAINGVSGAGTVLSHRYRIDWAADTTVIAVTVGMPDGSVHELRAPR